MKLSLVQSLLSFVCVSVIATGCAGGAASEPPATPDSAAAQASMVEAPPASAAPVEDSPAAAKNIVETASAAGSFTTLVAAVKAAGLVDTLSGPGSFTVFAPTDEAFKKLPAGTVESLLKPENKSKLVAILTFHVVPGKLMAKDVVGSKSLKTVQGQSLTVEPHGSMVHINGAMITTADIVASNGVIHVIDTVVLPK